MRSVLAMCLCASLMASPVAAAEPVKPEIVEEGVRAMQDEYLDFIRASDRPPHGRWDVMDPTRDTLLIEAAADNKRVYAIAQKLGIPHERIFVNLAMPYGSGSDGYNAMIDDELVMNGTELELAFIIAHEYAHNLLKHRLTASIDAYREQLAYCPDCTDPEDIIATVRAGFANPNLTALRERRKRLEMEADEWAARRVAQSYSVPDAASLFGPRTVAGEELRDTEGEVHPSRNKRLAAMDAVLAVGTCRSCTKN